MSIKLRVELVEHEKLCKEFDTVNSCVLLTLFNFYIVDADKEWQNCLYTISGFGPNTLFEYIPGCTAKHRRWSLKAINF